jgi:hypothetical protein
MKKMLKTLRRKDVVKKLGLKLPPEILEEE